MFPTGQNTPPRISFLGSGRGQIPAEWEECPHVHLYVFPFIQPWLTLRLLWMALISIWLALRAPLADPQSLQLALKLLLLALRPSWTGGWTEFILILQGIVPYWRSCPATL